MARIAASFYNPKPVVASVQTSTSFGLGTFGGGQLGRTQHSKHRSLASAQASVGIIMGSDSDLRIMKHAAQVLDCFGVRTEMDLVSAHRTPDRMFEYAKNAHRKGLKVIIAGAGGSAHLPGMVDCISPLAVIGVPINATSLQGMDSLLSIVQMPKGVPIATVSVDDARNAGMLAIRLLALSDERLRQRITYHKDDGGLEHLKASAELARCLERGDGNLGRSGSPVIGIVAGSISDLQPAEDAAAVLDSFGLQYEMIPVSTEYVRNAHGKGVKVMVVATGLCADLPVLVSRATPLPVIGIPTQRNDALDPLMVQREAPVGWVAIDNGMNAGLLAVRFLASADASLLDKMESYHQEMNSSVMSKAVKLQALGWKKYLQEVLA